MLIDSTVHLPVSLAMLDGMISWPSGSDLAHILIRWLHFVAGITWIGMLYFFNLVNVPLQKKLDADHGRTELRKQSRNFDWHRRHVRNSDAVECLGHHLAGQQTNHWRANRWPAARAGTCAAGFHRLAHQRVAIAADARFHGNGITRLGGLYRR